MAAAPQVRLGYIPALDGLRGVAILAVTLHHFFGLPGGFYGVDLFFVLSGFLITTLLLEDPRLGVFYSRRARRLLPAVGMLLVFLLPLVGPTLDAEGGLYLSNIFRAFTHPDPLMGTPLDHLWSLAEEEQFYLLWPLLLLLVPRRMVAPMLAGLFVVLVCYRAGLVWSGASFDRVYFAPDAHADGLVLGCVAAIVRPRLPGWLTWPSFAVAAAVTVMAAKTAVWEASALPVFEVAAAVLVVASVDGRAPWLRFRPLVWLGLISYSLYLWQQPARWLFRWAHPWPALAVALVAAWGSYRLVEQPFRRRRAGLEPAADPSAAPSAPRSGARGSSPAARIAPSPADG